MSRTKHKPQTPQEEYNALHRQFHQLRLDVSNGKRNAKLKLRRVKAAMDKLFREMHGS